MSEAQDVVVRSMRRDDAPAVHRMMKELATFEGVPEYPKFTVEELIKDGFESSPPWYLGLVATSGDGQLCGYAVFNRAYSSWTGCAYYLEDLYVTPETRGAGVAPLLLQRLCKMALENGVNRMDWHVLHSNARARAFYGKLGAHDLHIEEGRTAMRLDLDRIEAVAAATLDLWKHTSSPCITREVERSMRGQELGLPTRIF